MEKKKYQKRKLQIIKRQACDEPRPSDVNMTLPAFAVEHVRLQQISIDSGTRRRPGAQQQTRRTLLLLSIDRTDRQTDKRTDGHPTVT